MSRTQYIGTFEICKADPENEEIVIRGEAYTLCDLLMETFRLFGAKETENVAVEYGYKYIFVKCKETGGKYIYSTTPNF